MKKLLFVLLCVSMLFMSSCKIDSAGTADFTIETIAMTVGYDVKDSFEWTVDVDRYYNGIMEGKLSIDAAKKAESYLRTKTHPLIANRLVILAGKIGFNFDEMGNVINVDNVDIHLLQLAAQGFRTGILLND